MEGKKFFNVESSAFANGESKKNVDQELKEREEVALKIDLPVDSDLVKFFSSIEKNAREKIISSLVDRVNTVFKKDYPKDILKQVFESLNQNSFAEHIKTSEDFRRYAEKVLEIATLHSEKDKAGALLPYSGLQASWTTASTVADVIKLIRGNFDHDFDTLLQMMRDKPSPRQKTTIFGTLLRYKDFIKTSDDLQRFGLFVKRLSANGGEPSLGLHSFGRWHDEKQEVMTPIMSADAARFQEWKDVLVDRKKLDDALSIVELLSSLGESETVFVNGVGREFIKNLPPEQFQELKKYLSSFADRLRHIFVKPFQSEAREIFRLLNSDVFAERIKTPEDFRHYADKVLEVAELHLKKNDKNGSQIFEPGSAGKKAKKTVSDITKLVRGDFDHDFDTLLQMMRCNPSPNQDESIIGELSRIRGLVRTSEDLERFGQFVKRLSEKGVDIKIHLTELLGDQFVEKEQKKEGGYKRRERRSYVYEPNEQFKLWQEIITDSQKLDATLSVIETAFMYDGNPEIFAKKLNSLVKEEREQFLQQAQKFATKDIPPQFVVDNVLLLQDCDFSKNGLSLFSSFETQKKWLEYCVQDWQQNPQNIEKIAKFFNEAFVLKNEELRSFTSKLLESVIQRLFQNKNFEICEKIQESINGSTEAITALDQARANELSKNNLIKFIPLLGGSKETELLPITFGKAKELIFENLSSDIDLADYFVENLGKYCQQSWAPENVLKAIQHISVARKFIDYAIEDEIKWKDEAWVADVIAKAKTMLEEHEKQWNNANSQQTSNYSVTHGVEGFSKKDPYENHPWRFDERQARVSSALSKMMTDQGDSQALKELGINEKEMGTLLVEVNQKVEAGYQNFLEQIRLNQNVGEEDKQSLLYPELSMVKMTPLLDTIRSLVARYVAQSIEGDSTSLSNARNLVGDLDRIVAEGFNRYIKIHTIDIPLYDKLYEEFDNWREAGRYPLEVYLGRDGIYAWIGRRAQDIARRRKMGLAGRKKQKEMGEVIEIHPQYTVYPRYFRDNLSYETKRQFLEQEGISPDADPLFYDTGYTGTIPEQIMKVMDFDNEDIEKRIRLLSAPKTGRRVKGIPENARSEIIEYIEHNAKLEESAEGLIIDDETGNIRHIAQPTNPEDQFYFMMVKQAIERHYWLKEKLHHKPSENINFDSEHYSIRISQDYAQRLPQKFLHDPKAFFAEHGEFMKGSKGEGEYPDEEIFLFKLADDTGIVAKKIELRKSEEARKEFSVLIAAQKAGLPTAEPVGFLSGKEDVDGSYLLMKKIEGRSGRKFEKELREAGKYSDKQIKDIMNQVVKKNREMAELFRATLKIDKRWRIKDTIISFNEETLEIERVIPIDWERVQSYDPNVPQEIDEIA